MKAQKKPKRKRANVSVWAEYCWECPHCSETCRLPYQPRIGEELPPCESCGSQFHQVMADRITESCHP